MHALNVSTALFMVFGVPARGGGGHAPAMLQLMHPLLDGGHETPGPTCADAVPISSVRAARAKNIFNMKQLLPCLCGSI